MAEVQTDSSKERRRSARTTVSRPVLFAGARGSDMLRNGSAVDISAGGILVHTAQPELMGRHIELELHPEEGVETGEVIMVKGEVVRVDPLSGGKEFAMGIRFLQQAAATDATGPRLRPATEKESQELAGAIQKQLDAMGPAVRLEVSGAARKAAQKKTTKTRPPASPPEEPTPRRSGRAIALFILLIVIPALLGILLYLLWGLKTSRDSTQTPQATLTNVDTENVEEGTTSSEFVDPLERRLAEIESDGPAYYINRGSFLLVQGNDTAAAQAFRAAAGQEEATPVELLIARLGEAQALAEGGQTDEAIKLLEAPLPESEFVPNPWLQLKASFLDGLYNAPESPASRAPLVNAFTFRRTPGAGGQGGPAPEAGRGDARIEVDTNRHLLTVLKENAIEAVYPIGLGFDGRTPHGVFSISNKIENPDWYNGGSVVKAGDPANQLGSRWLGLADGDGPTPLGIHGTDDTTSIGANLSKGCIRMRPDDVEELFSRVSVGTPVHIRAL